MSRFWAWLNAPQNGWSVGKSNADASIDRAISASTSPPSWACQRRRPRRRRRPAGRRRGCIASRSPRRIRRISASWPAREPIASRSRTRPRVRGCGRDPTRRPAPRATGRRRFLVGGLGGLVAGPRARGGRLRARASSHAATASRAATHASSARSAEIRAASASTARRSSVGASAVAAARSRSIAGAASRVAWLIRLISVSHVRAPLLDVLARSGRGCARRGTAAGRPPWRLAPPWVGGRRRRFGAGRDARRRTAARRGAPRPPRPRPRGPGSRRRSARRRRDAPRRTGRLPQAASPVRPMRRPARPS